MGHEILYCHTCGKKLLSEDFTRGRAHTFNNRQYCTECLPRGSIAPAVPAPPPPRPPTQRVPKDRGTRTRPIPVLTPAAALPASRSSGLLFFVLGIVALGAALGILYVVVPFNAPAPEPEPPRPVPKVPEPRPDPTKAARQKEQYAAELKELETKAKPNLDRELFSAVIDLFEEARKRHNESDWDSALQKKIQEIRAIPAGLYPTLKATASAAQARGAKAELDPLRARVAGWGIKEWTEDLDKTLSTIVPRELPPAGATVLFNFPEAMPAKIRIMGTVTGAGLDSKGDKDARWLGWEYGSELFKIPTEGEVRLTFTTNKPALITLILRGVPPTGGPNTPYNFWLKKPELGRPQTVKMPFRAFQDWNKNAAQVGMPVDNIYIRQDDPTATLTVHSLVIFRTKP